MLKIMKVRVVVYCCKIAFSKKFEFWDDVQMPIIGNDFRLELYPGQFWMVKASNKIEPTDYDKYTTFFFESLDEGLFEILCDSLNADRCWQELEKEKN